MRDIKRIPPIMAKLEELWKLNPDMRLGQIVYLLADQLQEMCFTSGDIFYPEDDKWEEAIDSLIKPDILGYCPICDEALIDAPVCSIHGDVAGCMTKYYKKGVVME